MSKFPPVLALVLGASIAFADPCPKDSNRDAAPVSDPNLSTISTVTRATNELPDAPQPQFPISKNSGFKITGINPLTSDKGVIQKKPWFRIEFKLQGETGEKKPHVVDVILMDFLAINDPNNPNHAQAVADLNSAFNVYVQIINECQTPGAPTPGNGDTNGQQIRAPKPVARPIGQALTQGQTQCGPDTLTQYYRFLNQNQNLDTDAKIQLGSMIMSRISALYGNNGHLDVTSMEAVFQALRTGLGQAGICRDQHTFLAYTMSNLGCQDVGTLATDWNNTEATGGHVITYMRCGNDGKYIFANYEDDVATYDKYLSKAAVVAAEQLNSTSAATLVETSTALGKPVLHEMKTPREMALEATLDRAADLDRPMLDISIGDQESEIAFRKALARSDKNAFGVYVLAAGADPINPVAFGSAGISEKVSAEKPLTKNTELEVSESSRIGFMDFHDQIPSNRHGRNEMSFMGLVKAEADLAWTGEKNKGHVGVQGQIDANLATTNFDLHAGFIPYNILKVVAVDDPTKNVEIHGFSSFFINGHSNWQTTPGIHHQDDAVGVKVTGQSGGGKVDFSTDTTVHDFAGYAVGVHNETDLTIKSRRRWDFSLGNDFGFMKQISHDPFFEFALVTDSVSAKYTKSWSRLDFDAYVKYRVTDDRTFNLMQQDFGNPETWGMSTQAVFGITFRPKHKDDSQ